MAVAIHHAKSVDDQITALLPKLRRRAFALSGNWADADDLLQDCVVRALRSIGTFKAGTNLEAWLHTILRNVFRSGIRREQLSRDYARHVAIHETRSSSPPQIAQLQIAEVNAALGTLTKGQREAILLVALEDASYQDIAETTHVTEGTVKSRIFRGRAHLLKRLEGECHTSGP